MKPLDSFINLPTPVVTTELSQQHLRELIARMLSLSAIKWYYEPTKPHSLTYPTWIEQNWDLLKANPISVVKWAVQYLQNERGTS